MRLSAKSNEPFSVTNHEVKAAAMSDFARKPVRSSASPGIALSLEPITAIWNFRLCYDGRRLQVAVRVAARRAAAFPNRWSAALRIREQVWHSRATTRARVVQCPELGV